MTEWSSSYFVFALVIEKIHQIVDNAWVISLYDYLNWLKRLNIGYKFKSLRIS